ncbi:MAG TPA: histidine kinase dimerization/phospho-acceptor domain-containing protein [Blastocatellia bacterium]|nr:histidine kinase dimerization/phospho-acceptor domain-containing protein [Blastocatellia bacterium]
MVSQKEENIFILIACKNPIVVEASLDFDDSIIVHYAVSQHDLLSRINAGTPYRMVLASQQCSDWLSDEVYQSLSFALPMCDLVVVSEKSIQSLISKMVDPEGLLRENKALKTELQDHKLALQIAQQRIDEINALLEANGLQTMVQIVLSRIRHEINNPLTGVVGQAQLLLRRPESLSEETLRRIETIETLALRISEVFRNAEERFIAPPETGQESLPMHQ